MLCPKCHQVLADDDEGIRDFVRLALRDAGCDVTAVEDGRAALDLREVGVAAIPLSAFYEGGFEQQLARLCFAKRDETLRAALVRLQRL